MKISHFAALIAVLALILGGGVFFYIKYALPTPSAEPSRKIDEVRERRILAFGDSITYGYELSNIDDSYPGQLQKKLIEEGYLYKVSNFGVNGETTADALKRLPAALSYTPDILLLEFGANDYLQSLSPEDAQKNLDTIIQAFDNKNIKVILLNIEPNPLLPLPNKEQYAQIMPDLSKKYGIPIVSSFLDGVLLDTKYTLEDRLHPNKEGYTKALNENLWPVLKKELVKAK